MSAHLYASKQGCLSASSGFILTIFFAWIIDETQGDCSSTFTHESVYMTPEEGRNLPYIAWFKNFKMYCHMMIQEMSFDV